MTRKTASQIDTQEINENFPVAGQDNDTQTFRVNFSKIKNNFDYAKTEIEELQDSTAGLQLTVSGTDEGSNFGGRLVTNAKFKNNFETVKDGGTVSSGSALLSYSEGSYQHFNITANTTFNIQDLPTNGYGKIRLEITADATNRTISFVSGGGAVFKKNSTYPGSFTIGTAGATAIVDIWKRPGLNVIFLEYKGLFT